MNFPGSTLLASALAAVVFLATTAQAPAQTIGIDFEAGTLPSFSASTLRP